MEIQTKLNTDKNNISDVEIDRDVDRNLNI